MTTVVILAGGLATRLRPVTEKFPKALIDINGRPFIDYQLHLLKSQGLTDIIMSLGHEGQQVEAHLGDGSKIGMRLRYSYDGPTLLGTGGAVRKTLPFASDPFVVTYGDAYLKGDYQGFLSTFAEQSKHGKPQPLALMTVFRNENQHDRSNVDFQNGKLVMYDKKNPTAKMAYIDWGVGVLSHQAMSSRSQSSEPFDLADVYNELAKQSQLLGYEVFERFQEIGSFSGIEGFKKVAPELN